MTSNGPLTPAARIAKIVKVTKAVWDITCQPLDLQAPLVVLKRDPGGCGQELEYWQDPDTALKATFTALGRQDMLSSMSVNEQKTYLEKVAVRTDGGPGPISCILELGVPTRIVTVWPCYDTMLNCLYDKCLLGERQFCSPPSHVPTTGFQQPVMMPSPAVPPTGTSPASGGFPGVGISLPH